ncbi:hypothetical protein BU17DRAFT_69913 [Hysterangium stoloniferum]|nr:hypothetical protein BU17DRAFT_69913 [Hysterangium stoloniferum]
MVIKAMARNIGPLANVVILLLGVIYTVKILVHGTFIPRLSHYPQPAELIAHLRRFATHALAVSITSYVNMCEYCLHMLLVVSWFPLHQWSILKFLSFVAEKIFGPSLLPAPVADVSSSSKFMALFKVMIGAKIEPYHANIFVNLLPVSVSSQLMLRSCYHQSLAPVKGSLWKMLPAIPYMLAQSPMPADVIDQVISLFSGVEHSLEAEACPMVTSRITATFACVVVTPLMVVYLRRPIWNVCHKALCLVARAAGMMLFWLLKMAATIVFKLLKFVLGCICTVSAYRSYSLADDLMSSPLVPILMMHNPIAVRRVCILSSQLMLHTCYHQSLAPVRGSLWKILPAIQYVLAQSPMPADVIDQVISLFSGVGRSLEAEALPMVTSRITATFVCVVVTALMVAYLRRPIWNVCHQALCFVARAARMMLLWLLKIAATIVFNLLKSVSGFICTVSAHRSYSLADDPMPSPLLVPMLRNPIAGRRACIQATADSINALSGAQQGAPENTAADPTPSATTDTAAGPTPSATTDTAAAPPPSATTDTAAGPIPSATTDTAAGPTPSATTDIAAGPTPSATTTTAADPTPSAPTVPAADSTADSVDTLGLENINDDEDDIFIDEEITPAATTATAADPTPSGITAIADPTPSGTTTIAGDLTPSATTTTATDSTPSAATAPAADPTTNSVNTLGGAQQVAPENIIDDEDDIFIDEEITPAATTATAADPTPSGITAIADPTPSGTTTIAGDLTPSATTTTATDPTPSAATAPAADPTTNSVNTLGGAQQVASENIIDDEDDIFIDEEITPAATTTTAAEPTPSGTTAIAVDPTPSSTTATAGHIPPADTTASGGEGSEASMWALGNQAVEFPTKEEINDIWSAFHAMKRETKEELAATAKPMASPSIDTTASGGEGLEASIWAPGNQPVEYPAKEEQADIWSAFHAMKRRTKKELAATAKPMASPSIDTTASGGEGLEASIWAPGNQPVEYPAKEEQADIWSAFHAMKRRTKEELAATAKPMASPSIDTSASGGEGLEASIWAPGNQPVEYPAKEEQADIWGAFHAMKRQTKGELAAIAKPMASTSIDTAASDGEGLEASIWAPGNRPVEEQADLPASHSTKRRKAVSVSGLGAMGHPCKGLLLIPDWLGHFRHPPLANIGVEAYRADSRLDGAPAESIQTIPASYLGAYQLVRVNPAKGDPASM